MASEKLVLIASDHAGISLKAELKNNLVEWTWIDLGPTGSEKVDYPDFAQLLAKAVISQNAPRGILICGTGIGMSIAANKVPGIRAAVIENPLSARLSREHNDLNVLCLGTKILAPEYTLEIVKIWLSTPFSEDARHRKRIEKIHSLERIPL